MRRYLISMIAALIITVPLAVVRLGHSQAQGGTPTPTPSPTPTPTPTPCPCPSPSPTVSPTPTPSPTQQERKGDVEAGKARFMTDCKKCHGEQGQGNPAMYRLLRATLVHLGSAHAQQKSDEEIRKIMTQGFGKMEAIKGLSPEDVENILVFVRTLKQEPPNE